MRDSVVFKGSKNGLQLVIDTEIDFEIIISQLKSKLEAAGEFFANGNAAVQVPSAKDMQPEQRENLVALFDEYGLVWQEVQECDCDIITDNEKQTDEESNTLIISKTVRSGQEVVHSSSVVIMGDINPGAKVIAGGDIVVNGTCRGVAHAGAFGDETATITASRLLASQIRIASLISRSPDKLDIPEYAETARIRDGVVVIEPAR